ncbi:MAG: exodeoxyribonuclease III [Nanoarchaeota archaeon]|nr:exodeoxyribonuclease III [Nanoarchaeota archaeon]
MKIISWNVNGIRAVLKKNFLDFVIKENPDILCIQETKAHPDQVDEILHDYPHHFWNSAEKKGYSGTATFSKIKPLSVRYANEELSDDQGRTLIIEFEKYYLLNVYTPNSKRELERLAGRQIWDKDFLKLIKNLEKTKPVIICGDLNVAHKEIDIARPKANRRTAGFTDEERQGMTNYIEHGLIDTFREFNKEPNNYTWWSYMGRARDNNVGWRIDYFLISKVLRPILKDAFIKSNVFGSDHCPVGIILKD